MSRVFHELLTGWSSHIRRSVIRRSVIRRSVIRRSVRVSFRFWLRIQGGFHKFCATFGKLNAFVIFLAIIPREAIPFGVLDYIRRLL